MHHVSLVCFHSFSFLGAYFYFWFLLMFFSLTVSIFEDFIFDVFRYIGMLLLSACPQVVSIKHGHSIGYVLVVDTNRSIFLLYLVNSSYSKQFCFTSCKSWLISGSILPLIQAGDFTPFRQRHFFFGNFSITYYLFSDASNLPAIFLLAYFLFLL